MKKTIFSLIIVLLVAIPPYGCGYKLSGLGKSLPADMKSIAIPQFKNRTSRYQSEQFVTFAVREEFIRRSRLNLVESASKADGLLEGEITAFNIKPLGLDNQGGAQQYQVAISVDVKLIDNRSNEVLFEGKNISFSDSYETLFDDFFAQESVTLQKIARKFADSVVTTILENY
jgi:hypothetical protein